MRTLRRVCVYCGSSKGGERYVAAARRMGALLARRGVGVVYGGGRVGLMGELADAALAEGGEVIGVIPRKLLDLELGHDGLTDLVITDGMHARKLLMAELSDAFVALPGGFGTLEELFEVTTWTQLNDHHKPVGVLDVDGYYAGLRGFLAHAADEGFIRPQHRDLITFSDDADTLLDRLAAAEIPQLHAWIREV